MGVEPLWLCVLVFKEQGVDMEVMRASVLLSVRGVPLAVSTTAACNKSEVHSN